MKAFIIPTFKNLFCAFSQLCILPPPALFFSCGLGSMKVLMCPEIVRIVGECAMIYSL
jgi:hypothetical protein